MNEPIWLTRDAVVSIHNRAVASYGGLPGLRDADLLDSALCAPENLYAYTQPPPDLFEIAASYAEKLSQNHPFLDGNKRTAFLAAMTFIAENGVTFIQKDAVKAVRMIEALAQNRVRASDYASYLRTCADCT